MVLNQLSIEEKDGWGFTKEITITAADLAALPAGATTSFKLSNGAPSTVIGNFIMDLEQNFTFSDGTILACTVSVGDSGSNVDDLAAQSVLSGATPILCAAGTSKDALTATLQKNLYFSCTAAKNLNTATAGIVHILWTEVDLTKYRRV